MCPVLQGIERRPGFLFQRWCGACELALERESRSFGDQSGGVSPCDLGRKPVFGPGPCGPALSSVRSVSGSTTGRELGRDKEVPAE